MSVSDAQLVRLALEEGRPVRALVGVPEASLVSARGLARWAEAAHELALALAVWEGLVALDEGDREALEGLTRVALALGDGARAWDAAARLSVSPHATSEERDRAHLALARVALSLERPDEARRYLAAIGAAPPPEVRAVAALLTSRVG